MFSGGNALYVPALVVLSTDADEFSCRHACIAPAVFTVVAEVEPRAGQSASGRVTTAAAEVKVELGSAVVEVDNGALQRMLCARALP